MSIHLAYLKELLFPLGYKLDLEKEYPVFWKQIDQNDLRSQYAFSVITATLHSHSLRLEGLNEPRLIRAIKAGQVQIEKIEDLENLREVLFETTLDDIGNLEALLSFLELQLQVISSQPIYSDEYKTALKNIELIVQAANEVDTED